MKEKLKVALHTLIVLSIGLFVIFLFAPCTGWLDRAAVGELAGEEGVAYIITTFWYLVFGFIEERGVKNEELIPMD